MIGKRIQNYNFVCPFTGVLSLVPNNKRRTRVEVIGDQVAEEYVWS
jgi:hypothetical protein